MGTVLNYSDYHNCLRLFENKHSYIDINNICIIFDENAPVGGPYCTIHWYQSSGHS